MPDTWVFTDGLGRVSLTNAEVGDPRTDRTLALFYWTWHGFLRTGDPFNNQKFLEENPDALRDYDHPGWPVSGYDHFWNQPVYGYYKTTDTWVLRRQAEMLANAGVDTIFTDNTNGILTWRDSYRPLMQTWSDAMDDGVRTPKVSFMLPFGANEDTRAQLKDLYLDIYRKDVNQKLWFYWEGKPMLMAHGGGNLLNSADNTEKEIKISLPSVPIIRATSTIIPGLAHGAGFRPIRRLSTTAPPETRRSRSRSRSRSAWR